MATRSYKKLVRDKVPDAIISGGDDARVTALEDHEEILYALDEKLDEELVEYQMSKQLGDLADVLEVINAICEERGSSLAELDKMRKEKREKRGGFTKMLRLDEIIE